MMTRYQPPGPRQRVDQQQQHQRQRARRRTSPATAAAAGAAASSSSSRAPSPSCLQPPPPLLATTTTPPGKRHAPVRPRAAATASSQPPPPPPPPPPGSDAFAARQTPAVWRALDDPPPVLRGLRVVLVAPKGPENIGAACRALANFECPDLVVVAPRTAGDPRTDAKVAAVACGDSVRAGMRVVATLEEALADCAGGSVGMTRRGGATRATHESLDALEAAFQGAVLGGCGRPDGGSGSSNRDGGGGDGGKGGGGGGKGGGENDNSGLVALVFGREESGLTEGELRLCSHACAMPTGRVHASMNLAVAVAVALSWAYTRRAGAAEAATADGAAGNDRQLDPAGGDSGGGGNGSGGSGSSAAPRPPSPPVNPGIERSAAGDPRTQRGFLPASAAELDALLDKAAALAIASGGTPDESTGGGSRGTHGRRRKAQGHLRAVLQRARVTSWEARSLHGFLSAALRASGVSDERAALEGARARRRAWQRAQSGDAVAGGGADGDEETEDDE